MQDEINECIVILKDANIEDYILIDSKPKLHKDLYLKTLTKLADIYKELMKKQDHLFVQNCNKFLEYHSIILNVDFDNKNSKNELVNMYNSLCEHSINNNQTKNALSYLEKGLQVDPTNYTIHNNLGFIYKSLNQFNLSVMHYHLGIALNKDDIKVKSIGYLGLSCNFRSIQNWQQALFFLLKAEELSSIDPEIQNSLGVVYTEMRRTDLAEKSYLKGISYSENDKNMLESLYLNYGHMFFSNGDNIKSIELYNKVLKLNPKSRFAFQNKIMNLVYLNDDFTDHSYTYKQHLLINKIFKKSKSNTFTSHKSNSIVNIGMISGDFIGHPVSYFISTFLQNYNHKKYNVFCYSECLIDTKIFNDKIKFTLIRGVNTDDVCDIIQRDNIHILFDLSGHTGYNRMDVFAKKPAKVQISYIGYPYTTGLFEMDYRITDSICDVKNSQIYYTEKLLFLQDCFLCYNPLLRKQIDIKDGPKKFTIGCFNRLNKISNNMILLINKILDTFDNVYFIFKTKALLNKVIKQEFLEKIKDKKNRVQVIDCAILHESHLEQYNLINVSLDTFPYSGTTTSCESLLMGVPVLSLYDNINYFHPQNVTVSILKNSNLDYFVCHSHDDIIKKIGELQEKGINKESIKKSFITGKVCDSKLYMNNFTKLIDSIL